jgi:uncharacterized protein YndB with AHSA1/START domain
MNLPHQLDRVITIAAPPATVFSFFTDNERWAAWWGPGSTIDPRPGGRVHIVHPNNVEVTGEVVAVSPPESIVFTYGYTTLGAIAPGGSLVTIRLEPYRDGTRLHLTHAFDDSVQRDHHIQGWRFQLSLFSNAVLNLLHSGAEGTVDAWFGLWSQPEATLRAQALARIASPDVRFHDRFSALAGVAEVDAHVTAAQRFMPGLVLRRRGSVRHCQGVVLADWDAVGSDGGSRGAGTNVFYFGADGRIVSATGFWSAP